MTSVATLAAATAGGCHEPTGPRTIANPDPAVKIPAMKSAVAERDRDKAAAMVKNLESDDPAVRLFAIEGLRRLTGEDFGYDYYADADQRAPAVQRWKQWLEMQSND
jgi:hypothetical protein